MLILIPSTLEEERKKGVRVKTRLNLQSHRGEKTQVMQIQSAQINVPPAARTGRYDAAHCIAQILED
jgi:hypothetical protein